MPDLRRVAAASRCGVREDKRQDDHGAGEVSHQGTEGIFRHTGAAGERRGHRSASAHGDTPPPPLPRRGGARLSDARPSVVVALRRREPAHQPRHLLGIEPRGLALHPRRAEHRATLARHTAAHRSAPQPSAARQHGCGGGARRGDHAGRRLYSRHRPRRRASRRRSGV